MQWRHGRRRVTSTSPLLTPTARTAVFLPSQSLVVYGLRRIREEKGVVGLSRYDGLGCVEVGTRSERKEVFGVEDGGFRSPERVHQSSFAPPGGRVEER